MRPRKLRSKSVCLRSRLARSHLQPVRRLTDSYGYITDGIGNYSSDLQCTWLIDSFIENATIRLQFISFETECSWDHLYIFDGDSLYAPMLAAFSGSLMKDGQLSSNVPEITAHSGRAYLYFYSDAAYNMTGFNISYSINSCPQNCSNHGVCVGDRCTCDAEFEGDACERHICPNGCSGNGECDKTNHRCVCHYGFVGNDCSQTKSDGYWSSISTINMPKGRALHQAITYNDAMYVVGGEHFQSNEPFLIKYDMKRKKWDSIFTPDSEPSPRFGHSAIAYNHRLLVHGGILRNGNITSDLWEFDFLRERWNILIARSSSNSDFCCPIASVGHTATLVDNIMIIIFGYNPTLGYLNHVQHYNIDLQFWELIKTTGASVKGGFGHSSTYDHLTRLIYVFGGYHSFNFADNILVDLLYAYDPKKESWSLLSPSNSPRYLHSASIINGLLLIYGGNGHNVTDDNSGDICFSPQFLAYDITCDNWRTLKLPSISNIDPEYMFGRYGHSNVVHEDSLYIFGGFNGIMHNSLLRYVPGNCSHFMSADDCTHTRTETKCIWNKEKQICQSFNQAKLTSNYYCQDSSRESNITELCQRHTLCSNCVSTHYDCVWCGEKCLHKKCSQMKAFKESSSPKMFKGVNYCEPRELHISNCDKLHNCHSCHTEHHCSWQRDRKCSSLMYDIENWSSGSKIKNPSLDEERATCEAPCHTRNSCENCTQGSCMWCSSKRQCIESNAYSAIYPIGQCMEWTTHPYKCSVLTCTDIQSCDKCLKNPQCGWCDNGSGTGVGVCLEGSSRGPFAINSTHKTIEWKRCPAPRWYFTECPECQCNGHSKCSVTFPGVCNKPCNHFTEGINCDRCIERYYGHPINGGTCTPCSCNGHSDFCHRETGKCSCTTKGITGHHCDKCDEQNNYIGNPQELSGSCYYNLSTSYSYTFNMSKSDDKFYTRINFMNMPLTAEIDIEFMVGCQDSALINISVGSGFNNTLNITRQLFSNLECGNIKLRFTHDEHFFGIGNTTFFVNVYNFRTPFVLQISFSQHRNLDILQFFLTFSSCFLALLIIAAFLWKIKQKYELYRRRQQLFVEMEQMASRPFAGVVLQMKNLSSNTSTCTNPTPIALEPCNNGKAAVLTLIVRLPSGGQQIPPSGQTGIALASALVSLGNVSLEQNYKEDKGSDKGPCNKVAANSTTKLNNISTSFSTGV
ncbi:hypothetical protein RDWZM_000628 [Blomia tropicalis]|uniref:Attractin-like protein 1 n=1 Tax=Blomia tropicalis TaxID=40697 RepID=A0A9Q0RN65_BLOTA|nr:hypothetical protein RDWZM_000628 [Blomia tropicalis]